MRTSHTPQLKPQLLGQSQKPRRDFGYCLGHEAEGRGIEIFILRLRLGSLWASVATDASGGDNCSGGGGGAGFLSNSLGPEDLGGKRSYFVVRGLKALGTHLTKAFVRIWFVRLNFNLPCVVC